MRKNFLQFILRASKRILLIINLKKYMFITLLQTLFIGLKLTSFIDWNWFLVLSPFLLTTLIILSPFIYSFVLKIISILKKQ
jgi:hypothetical protein